MGGMAWKPTRELTRTLRGGWVMRVRGRGDLGRIEQRGHGRAAVFVPYAADGRELDHSPTLRAAATQLWEQPPASTDGRAAAR